MSLASKAIGAVAVLAASGAVVAQIGGSNGGPTIEEEIKEWGLRAQGVQDDFHPLCLKVLERVMETSNATIALQLQNAMPKILRKREFASWLAQVSPIRLYDEDKDSNFTKCELRKEDDKFYRKWDMEKAKAEPFFNKKEEVKALDPSKIDMVKTLVTNMTSLARSILGEGEKAKKLVEGSSKEEAQKKLKELRGMHVILNNAKMTGPLPGATSDLVTKALAA